MNPVLISILHVLSIVSKYNGPFKAKAAGATNAWISKIHTGSIIVVSWMNDIAVMGNDVRFGIYVAIYFDGIFVLLDLLPNNAYYHYSLLS